MCPGMCSTIWNYGPLHCSSPHSKIGLSYRINRHLPPQFQTSVISLCNSSFTDSHCTSCAVRSAMTAAAAWLRLLFVVHQTKFLPWASMAPVFLLHRAYTWGDRRRDDCRDSRPVYTLQAVIVAIVAATIAPCKCPISVLFHAATFHAAQSWREVNEEPLFSDGNDALPSGGQQPNETQ